MDETDRVRAAMDCPVCGRTAMPLPLSTFLVAWYACAYCNDTWSARLRDGRPAVVWHNRELLPTKRA